MKIIRTAACGLTGMFCAGFLQGCGGYHAGSAAMTPTSISISINPTSVVAGRAATLMWSATSGTSCAASGAWSGAQPASGSMTITPTGAGSEVFTLTCSSGVYSSNSASATLTVTAASAVTVTELVANVSGGTAAHLDTNLVNPWGVSIPAAPSTAPAWVANNGSQTSTLYDGNGVPQPATPLIVNLAVSAGGAAFDPTGVVANSSSTDFVVSAAAKSGASAFVFDGAGGMIAGWAPSVDLTHAITMYADAGGAIYKGLAIASNNGALFLYATDFHNSKIDVFDTSFIKQTASSTSFTFVDPAIPAGYAPFGIQAVPGSGAGGATQIFVTYAQQVAPANVTNVNGAGLGFVDIYDTNGKLIKQLIAGGALNAPWGIAMAPADFGTFSNALLVGNFGDGTINAYDAGAGTPLGKLADTNSGAAAAPGLLGIAFGNDANSQPHNTLFFAAGPNGGADGVYGRIDLTNP